MNNTPPIIVKRISRKASSHHGGSWKIAFADFAIAMMAFFLVMWLVTVATPAQLNMISAYFNDPINFDSGSPFAIDLGGSPTVSPERTLNELPTDQLDAPLAFPSEFSEPLPDKMELMELDLLLQELQNRIDTDPVLQRFREQILLEFTREGLRIQIVDAENRPMFASGSPNLQPYFEEILLALSDVISKVPKKITISGHTDAQPYMGRLDYGNWELSTQRANAARRTLLASGFPEERVTRVVGYADSALFDQQNPLNPINRRIDIVVMNKRAEDDVLREARGSTQDAASGLPAAEEDVPETLAVESDEGIAPEPAAPAETDRPRNLFDEPVQPLELRQP